MCKVCAAPAFQNGLPVASVHSLRRKPARTPRLEGNPRPPSRPPRSTRYDENLLPQPGLLLRHEGDMDKSLEYFQKAMHLNPHHKDNAKQVARSLFLMSRHRAAIAVYEQVSWPHVPMCPLPPQSKAGHTRKRGTEASSLIPLIRLLQTTTASSTASIVPHPLSLELCSTAMLSC